MRFNSLRQQLSSTLHPTWESDKELYALGISWYMATPLAKYTFGLRPQRRPNGKYSR